MCWKLSCAEATNFWALIFDPDCPALYAVCRGPPIDEATRPVAREVVRGLGGDSSRGAGRRSRFGSHRHLGAWHRDCGDPSLAQY
jgi:hypothetical protein